MLAMHADGAHRFVEVGPGKVLTKLARRIVPDAAVETVKVEAARA
jgi:malonyl CoA-acyl carrier protein transacylase